MRPKFNPLGLKTKPNIPNSTWYKVGSTEFVVFKREVEWQQEAAHLMLVSRHTALLVVAAAQALQTLAVAARSLRGRWRKMSANTSSGSFSPGSTMVWWEGRGAGLLLPAAVPKVKEGALGSERSEMPTLGHSDAYSLGDAMCFAESVELPACEMTQQIKAFAPNTDDLSSILGTQWWKGRSDF